MEFSPIAQSQTSGRVERDASDGRVAPGRRACDPDPPGGDGPNFGIGVLGVAHIRSRAAPNYSWAVYPDYLWAPWAFGIGITTTMRIRVPLADDHALFRQGMAEILDSQPDF